MVHANNDLTESSWLDEGMSELAAALTGFRKQSGFVYAFAAAPDTQLNTWSEVGSSAPHYGASYLFVTYFLQRFGEQALLTLNKDPLHDLEGVADALQQIKAADPATGKPVTVEGLFADWVITNLVNDAHLGDGRFAYTRLPSVLPSFAMAGNLASDAPQAGQVTQWGTTYLKLAQPGHYTLTFAGDPTVQVVPVAPHSGTHFWWSNRGDQIDTRLTHRFDLRSVQRATLDFWLWYAIEENWDYGYVQVSTDDGQTWTALSSQDSAPAGGDNNPYGPGYTGKTPGWQHESVDLSAYTGREILVRFEYLTDAAINDFGMALDDISIPEIGYSTDAESDDDGWVTEGWARIENRLPQRYLLQVVEPGSVARLLDSTGGARGTWTIDVSLGQPALFALSGLTEFTTETARYTLALVH
jgi:immune inhibitor A